MGSYICGDHTTIAAAEGVARYLGCADGIRDLCDSLRAENEAAACARYGGHVDHQPVDVNQRRAYTDLEIIGACECLAYQLDVSSAFDGTCGKLRAAAAKIKHDGAKAGKWRLPGKSESLRFDGVYLPVTYRARVSGGNITVYDDPVEIPWGLDR